VEQGKAEGIKAIIVERYYDPRSAETVAKAIGAAVVVIPGDVGGEPEARSYPEWIELVVSRVTAAYR
jgi:zinc/manganese transport system substrate-binding protein